jgi:hypothetical protein
MEPHTGYKREPRNIVLCFDGTGDWAATDTTNVMKIYERLGREDQLIYYSGGVGTLNDSSSTSKFYQIYYRLLDLATAKTLQQHVLDGYAFLVENYREEDPANGIPADRIFLFGFSRGAFTARLVAALIHIFGLVKKEHANLIPYLWQTVSSFKTFGQLKREARRIQNDFARDWAVKVHFMGLFDTVSSVGIFDRFKVYPYTNKNSSVEHIRHAVSIHEQRNAFPELLITPDHNDVVEIWFPGVHRDIGGGDAAHPWLSNRTLNWMMEEASQCGLRMDKSPLEVKPADPNFGSFDYYVFVGLYPMKMFDYALVSLQKPNWNFARVVDLLTKRKRNDSGFRFYWPNFIHRRPIPTNANVFDSEGLIKLDNKPVQIRDARNPDIPIYAAVGPNWHDSIGTLLGVTVAVLIAVRGLVPDGLTWSDEQAIVPWPGNSSTVAFWLFMAYVIQQGLSQRLASQKRLTWINEVMPGVGILALVFALWKFHPWVACILGAGFGVVVTLLAQAGKPPILRADRAVAYFMCPWFLLILASWLANLFLGIVWNPLMMAIGWLVAPDGGFWIPYQPWLREGMWCIAALSGLFGLIGIVQDRAKMKLA